jgi:hypothetical protein
VARGLGDDYCCGGLGGAEKRRLSHPEFLDLVLGSAEFRYLSGWPRGARQKYCPEVGRVQQDALKRVDLQWRRNVPVVRSHPTRRKRALSADGAVLGAAGAHPVLLGGTGVDGIPE